MSTDSILDAIVVGAGPSGLILANMLAKANANFTVLERNKDVGGIWDIDAPNSPMYESAHFISSKTLSTFPGFPMPDHFPDYPSHSQILEYIKSFAEHHALHQHIQFNTSVKNAELNDSGNWDVELANGDTLVTRYLICANGVTWEPNIINWDGDFNGEVRHSVTYRSADEFKGKRVLVVGAGNSGVDIACDAAFAADQAYLSTRRGYHFVPKYFFGKPTDVFNETSPNMPHALAQRLFGFALRMMNGKLEQYGLPEPDHKLFQTHPIMNTQILHYLGHGDCIAKPDVEKFDGDYVVFADGSREKIDLVIAATGYQHSIPFLDDSIIDFKNGRPDLYMNIFPRRYPNLAVLGFIEFASAAYKNFSNMAELIVEDVVHKNAKLNQLKTSHEVDLKGGHKYLNTVRNANYVDVETYLKELSNVKQKIGLVE